jgi:organic hydroperoxide reductase OsmC/OhrA
MQELPYEFHVTANAEQDGNVLLKAEHVPRLVTAPCAGSDGKTDQWCPEMLLVAAVTDGFVLGFRAISRTAKFDWNAISCKAAGTLDRVDKINRFTDFRVSAILTIPGGADAEKARRLMEKAQASCAIANSLLAEFELQIEIVEA